MILDVLLWVPIKVMQHFLRPVTETFDHLADMSNQAIDDHFKENPPKA